MALLILSRNPFFFQTRRSKRGDLGLWVIRKTSENGFYIKGKIVWNRARNGWK